MRARSAVSQSYVDTQLMIPRKKAEPGSLTVIGGEGPTTGIMPYFFGWTVHVPPDSDIVLVDPFSSTNLDLWSFVLPAPAIVNRLSYYIALTVSTFVPSHFINIGLYDADFNLIFQTGPIDVQNHAIPGQTLDGAYTFDLGADFQLAPGEYFMAIASGACIRIWGISTSRGIPTTLLDHAEVQDQGLLTPGPFGARMFEFVPNGGSTPGYLDFPSVLDTSVGTFNSFYEDQLDAPLILYEGIPAQYLSP